MKNLVFSVISAIIVTSCAGFDTDVLVIGGGASGTAAAIQAARDGASVVVVEETPWLGGMLTSAGVSAVDGNYNIRGGIFGELLDSIAVRYGGYENIKSGWVSNVLFEPKVGEEILENIVAKEPNITLMMETTFVDVKKMDRGWKVDLSNGKTIKTKILIDGTELGDVAKACGVPYRIGIEDTGEIEGFKDQVGIIQDLTYVITIKDYGRDMTIAEPEGYDRLNYVNCCKNPANTDDFEKGQQLWDVWSMLHYGWLPNGEVMLNWPVEANDYYLNIIEMTPAERAEALKIAKNKALGYLYFMQTELGLSNWGIADDQYPTEDGLPLIPYHRESRRINGLINYTSIEAEYPYSGDPLYRTGIAVGDYPIDHHHFAHSDWKNLPKHIFRPIPAFNVPLGVVIPEGIDDLIVAEKSISVSNVMNGTTRLQPVVVELGQAAGVIAAICSREGFTPSRVSIREVQSKLLEADVYLVPIRDRKPSDEDFVALQKICACGILHYTGMKVGWANECWLFADEPLKDGELFLEDYPEIDPSKYAGMTRGEAAVAIDAEYHPFESHDIDIHGFIK